MRYLLSFAPMLAVLATILGACSHPSPLSPPPDASPDAGWTDPLPDEDPEALLDGGASPAVAACSRLAKLGCSEAHPAVGTCAGLISRVQASHLTDLRPTCIARARTVEAVRACGVRCGAAP